MIEGEKVKSIRFKTDCRVWIRDGIKTTTFRRNRRLGLYEIVEGSWFHPKGLGILIRCYPIKQMYRKEVIESYWESEGDFKNPESFRVWLKENGLELVEYGWLNHIDFLTWEDPPNAV